MKCYPRVIWKYIWTSRSIPLGVRDIDTRKLKGCFALGIMSRSEKWTSAYCLSSLVSVGGVKTRVQHLSKEMSLRYIAQSNLEFKVWESAWKMLSTSQELIFAHPVYSTGWTGGVKTRVQLLSRQVPLRNSGGATSSSRCENHRGDGEHITETMTQTDTLWWLPLSKTCKDPWMRNDLSGKMIRIISHWCDFEVQILGNKVLS